MILAGCCCCCCCSFSINGTCIRSSQLDYCHNVLGSVAAAAAATVTAASTPCYWYCSALLLAPLLPLLLHATALLLRGRAAAAAGSYRAVLVSSLWRRRLRPTISVVPPVKITVCARMAQVLRSQAKMAVVVASSASVAKTGGAGGRPQLADTMIQDEKTRPGKHGKTHTNQGKEK